MPQGEGACDYGWPTVDTQLPAHYWAPVLVPERSAEGRLNWCDCNCTGIFPLWLNCTIYYLLSVFADREHLASAVSYCCFSNNNSGPEHWHSSTFLGCNLTNAVDISIKRFGQTYFPLINIIKLRSFIPISLEMTTIHWYGFFCLTEHPCHVSSWRFTMTCLCKYTNITRLQMIHRSSM